MLLNSEVKICNLVCVSVGTHKVVCSQRRQAGRALRTREVHTSTRAGRISQTTVVSRLFFFRLRFISLCQSVVGTNSAQICSGCVQWDSWGWGTAPPPPPRMADCKGRQNGYFI